MRVGFTFDLPKGHLEYDNFLYTPIQMTGLYDINNSENDNINMIFRMDKKKVSIIKRLFKKPKTIITDLNFVYYDKSRELYRISYLDEIHLKDYVKLKDYLTNNL